jgi:hypothetical protein
VAELNDQYIAKMEDVLETYEKPYDPQEPVVCVDEKPVTLHARRVSIALRHSRMEFTEFYSLRVC